MTHRTIVITGGSDGIGAAAARRLGGGGDDVVVVGRSESKTAAVAAEFDADYFVADFGDLAQVRALADKIRSNYPRIDVLLNNAGGMSTKIQLTSDGYEHTYQVNYLSPFLLTTRLLPVLLDSRATVVNTTSSSHKLVRRATVDDLENTARRGAGTAYALSKLAIVLFTRELHRRHHAGGLSAATVHPGYVNSNFGRASGSRFLVFMQQYTPQARFTASVDEGADQLVWLASTAPGVEWTPGEYYVKRKIAKPGRLAIDPRLAGELWERTASKLGLFDTD
ncbi:short-chain dehydrogenase [Mycobacterium florentinum]|uniref:Short-chain dehydrogenase n=1 Tax=Mycobacterium florentinum TaxID=292462 RepID=A0A1X1UE49_MYCFL|nr:SDR family NAD(P)-dependent oxidoreductase [Mycobacterium florentinum]MCV7411952.1 SDR family NAD(P)-dependent oxidoreductase [Mycobacterium florentinum]ORV55061.1 short-chain dehydrogenase [Mycobacterium florentinum]BBX81317.1 short-chain dehydrogenase [Mycobacterium florentinum]